MDEGFEKGQSDNLPKIDVLMVAHYFSKNSAFVTDEIQGAKIQKSERESYGDDAIGYVQVKWAGDICTVKCRITPEHRVRLKPYHCSLECNEQNNEILNLTCEDCAASKGSCKHAVALLMWLHRRSEESSTTSIKCYWKKSELADIGTTPKMIKAKDFGTGTLRYEVEPNKKDFFNKVTLRLREFQIECSLSHYVCEKTEVERISIHYLINHFIKTCVDFDVDSFITFCKNEMTESRCLQVKEATMAQSDSNLWFEMRYGRIAESRMHEAANCKTTNGSLVEEIFSAVTFKETAAIKRGKTLEKDVMNQISRVKNVKITGSGLILSNKWPMIGASPDGLTDDCVVDIKCPYKENTFDQYHNNGKLSKQYYAEVQTQMHMSGKRKGLFCVAHVDFETTNNVDVHEVLYDKDYCDNLVEKCIMFWKNHIYDKLIK